jgi:hypothetical protein
MARKVSKAGRRRTRKMRGGYYSFSGGIAPGAMAWSRSTEVPVLGGRRRRRKSGRKTRKMRGGGGFGGVSAGFVGTGSRGVADYVPVGPRGAYSNGGAAQGAFNNYGAGPGSKF